MKYINRFLLLLGLCTVSFSCDLDLQDNPNAVPPEDANLNELYNSVQLNFSDVYSSAQFIPGATVRMYHAGQFDYKAYITFFSFNGVWNIAYAGLFPDVEVIIAQSDAGGSAFHGATARIMKAYALMVLVDLFGDVPLSEIGQGLEIISPKTDSGADVYNAAITLLDEAIDSLDANEDTPPDFDNMYDGDADGWIKAANTLKLRAALNMGDVTTFDALVAAGNLIETGADDFEFHFSSNRLLPDSRSPLYSNHYETDDGDYLSNYYMWMLTEEKQDADGATIVDPRARYYFYRKVANAYAQDATTYGCHYTDLPEESAGNSLNHWDAVDLRLRDETFCVLNGGYSGRSHLNGGGIPPDGPIRTSYGLYPFGGDFDDNMYKDTRKEGTTGGSGAGISPIMLSSFTNFMKAEAVLSIGATGDARASLEAGIRESMDKVVGFESLVPNTLDKEITFLGEETTIGEVYGTTPDDIDAYVVEVLAMYDAETSDDGRLDVVSKEYYIAAWGNGLEVYNMYRRTGYPSNMQPALEAAPGAFPNSMEYPNSFTDRNSNVDSKGLDDLVFWDSGTTTRY